MRNRKQVLAGGIEDSMNVVQLIKSLAKNMLKDAEKTLFTSDSTKNCLQCWTLERIFVVKKQNFFVAQVS